MTTIQAAFKMRVGINLRRPIACFFISQEGVVPYGDTGL